MQAALVADRLCKHGADETNSHVIADFLTCIRSISVVRPQTIDDIYGPVTGLRRGLAAIHKISAGELLEFRQPMQYLYNMLQVQQLLNKDADMQTILRNRITRLPMPGDELDDSTDQFCQQVDRIYRDTLSTLKRRIALKPGPRARSNRIAVCRLRTLMLAGVRAATLWHQYGGRIWLLFLERNRISATASQLLRLTDTAGSSS